MPRTIWLSSAKRIRVAASLCLPLRSAEDVIRSFEQLRAVCRAGNRERSALPISAHHGLWFACASNRNALLTKRLGRAGFLLRFRFRENLHAGQNRMTRTAEQE